MITYGPHKPLGSSDKLYEISPDLSQVIREESVGGTPANRLIHEKSEQLNIGPYFIRKDGSVRVISPTTMPGRHTGSARHLTDPNKIYIATMEEGLYSVDMESLEVHEHVQDGNKQAAVGGGVKSKLPGYHGKGLYSGQGSVFYSNNGERDKRVTKDPTINSGALASWSKPGSDWKMLRRNQFTEVTGPGGIKGNENPATDPIWALGWDHKSVLLALIENGKPQYFRLPKASHSYDGSHGWNTEWPRIRGIGKGDELLATMHGTFWKFPKTFRSGQAKGIRPRSNYLKVIGDFTTWNDKVVLGCDDSAQKEFLNHRPFKAAKAAPTQSNSNLWFVDDATLDSLGPAIGRGSVWLKERVEENEASDSFLLAGYDYRTVAIQHDGDTPASFELQIDPNGSGQFETHKELKVEGSTFYQIPKEIKGEWIRVVAKNAANKVTVHFHFRDKDTRTPTNSELFEGFAQAGTEATHKGLLRGVGNLIYIKNNQGLFAVDDGLKMKQAKTSENYFKGVAQPLNVVKVDEASVILKEDGKTYRFPKNDAYKELGRVCREVATERDLLNLHGTFYELPARNALGLSKVRPVATHNLQIDDYGSQFGLLFMTGLKDTNHHRVLKDEGGKAAVWTGVIDELWKLGKPRGKGGPWKNSKVKAGQASDPYLMTGYDKKSVTLLSDKPTEMTLEVDVDGTGVWLPYKTFELSGGTKQEHTFPEGFSAYWVRARSSKDVTAEVQFTYE